MNQELNWTPFYTLFLKENKRFLRVAKQTLLIPIVNSSLYLLIFGVSLGSSISLGGEQHYLAFLIPGILMMACLNNSFQNTSSSISTSKFHGDFEDFRVVPLTPFQIAMAMSLGGLVRGLAVAFLIFGVGEIFYYFTIGELLGVSHPFFLIYFLVAGGLAFSNLGIVVGFWAKNFDQMTAIGGFILLPLMYLGGVFFSLGMLHPFWQTLSKFNPMLYFINGVRYGILGTSDVNIELCALFSVLTTLFLYILAFRNIKYGNYSRW